jgi:hypothetical protein
MLAPDAGVAVSGVPGAAGTGAAGGVTSMNTMSGCEYRCASPSPPCCRTRRRHTRARLRRPPSRRSCLRCPARSFSPCRCRDPIHYRAVRRQRPLR